MSIDLVLVTAKLLYRRPDHLWLLQDFIWQDYDLLPEFPELKKFVAFWRKNLDGPLVSVIVAHRGLDIPRPII